MLVTIHLGPGVLNGRDLLRRDTLLARAVEMRSHCGGELIHRRG